MDEDEPRSRAAQDPESPAPGEPADAGLASPLPPAAEPPEAAPPAPPPCAGGSDTATLSTVADGVERPLDPRAVRLQRTVSWIVAGVVGFSLLVALAFVIAFAPLPGWVDALLLLPATALALVLVWSAQVWPEIEHRHASYKVDRERIEIRRGVLWRTVIDVPRSRVQHTDVSQGPLERTHGLGTLVVYTAGTAHAKVELHGLDHGTALAIRDHLLPGDGGDAV